MEFTLVSTVFNEAKRLAQTIADLKQQTLQPSEIIVTDAGSNDGTYDMLKKWAETSEVPIIILQKNRCNVAEGRNMAIRAAKYDIIASTDFGCRFKPDWLENIIPPFSDPLVDVVGGGFSINESEQNSLASKADYILSNGYNIDVYATNFIPSSRSIAYRKSVFEKIGGYCEWLTLAADDMVFGLELLAHHYKIHVSPKPCVSWIRHSTAKGYLKESYRYGLGNGEAHVGFKTYKEYIIQFISRVLFLLSAIVLVFFNLQVPFYIPLVLMLLTASAYLPYYGYFKKWLKFRSKKYNFSVLLYGFLFYERLKLIYIKAYTQGYYYSPAFRKAEAKLLEARLNNKNAAHA